MKMKRNKMLVGMVTGLIALFIMANSLLATTVNITPSDDLWLISRAPDNNLRTLTTMRVGPRADEGMNRSIVKFDLSTIPQGAVITSVKLYLYATQTAENTSDFYDVYTASGTGVTTWNYTTATWNSTQPNWTYTLAEDDEVFITQAGFYSWDITSSLSAGDIVTFGILSKIEEASTNQRAYFATSRYEDTNSHPYLEITYTVPEPTAMMMLLLSGIGFIRKFR